MPSLDLDEPLPLPAVEHYSDQWADGYRAGLQDVANYLRTDGKSQIVQWVEGMLMAISPRGNYGPPGPTGPKRGPTGHSGPSGPSGPKP